MWRSEKMSKILTFKPAPGWNLSFLLPTTGAPPIKVDRQAAEFEGEHTAGTVPDTEAKYNNSNSIAIIGIKK